MPGLVLPMRPFGGLGVLMEEVHYDGSDDDMSYDASTTSSEGETSFEEDDGDGDDTSDDSEEEDDSTSSSDSDDDDDEVGSSSPVFAIPTEKSAKDREANGSGGVILEGSELATLLNNMRSGKSIGISAKCPVPVRRSSISGVVYYGQAAFRKNSGSKPAGPGADSGSAAFPSIRTASMPTLSELRLKLMQNAYNEAEQENSDEDDDDVSLPDIDCPHELVQFILEENGFDSDLLAAEDVPTGFFQEITDERIQSYKMDIITAVQNRSIASLRKFRDQGRNLLCCNRFGESILHMACRRGSTDVVEFLLTEALVSIRQRDDYGKTAMHDACWTASPCLRLVELLIRCCPDLLVICDKRNHTPLQYVSKDHWPAFCKFLWQKRDIIKPRYLVKTRSTLRTSSSSMFYM